MARRTLPAAPPLSIDALTPAPPAGGALAAVATDAQRTTYGAIGSDALVAMATASDAATTAVATASDAPASA